MLKRLWKKHTNDILKNINLDNGIVELRTQRIYKDYYNNALVENYVFGIYLSHTECQLGFCDLRLGDEKALLYLGNIGYNIFYHHRGHGYAKSATNLLFTLARELKQETVTITCNTDNIASIKTIEACQCEFIDTLTVPADEPLFQQGDYFKHIFKKIL